MSWSEYLLKSCDRWAGRIAAWLFILTNSLFVAKYGIRISLGVGIIATIAYAIVCRLLVLPFAMKSASRTSWHTFLLAVFVACMIVMMVLQMSINPYDLQIDRWSALHNPIDFLLNGQYPYRAHTHLGGSASPFPVWQLVHIPFYLLGNVGLSLFVALILFAVSVWRTWGRHVVIVCGILFAGSPALWYEAAVRSDLLTNMLVVAAFSVYVLKRIDAEWLSRHVLSVSFVAALLACTRVVTIVPMFILLFPSFLKLDNKKKVMMLATSSLFFALTFVPFALWDWHEFFYFEYNPWRLQMRQGYPLVMLVGMAMLTVASLSWKGRGNICLINTALLLDLIVVVSFVVRMFESGNFDLFSPAYDITYFSMALPFCIAAVSHCVKKQS